MQKSLLLALLLCTHWLPAQETETVYSMAEVREDLTHLFQTMEASHYNLYLEVSKEDYRREFQRLQASISDSLTLLEVYRRFQPFVALAGQGHATLDFPFSRLYGNYAQSGGTLFPVNVRVDGDRVYIKSIYADNTTIGPGDELLSINGRPVSKVMEEVYRYLSGESDYLKTTVLDMVSFPRMLWILEETVAAYSVKVKKPDGSVVEDELKPVLVMKFEEQFATEGQVFRSGRDFHFVDGVAYLRPGVFMNEQADGNTSESETFEKEEFVRFIDSAFTAIHQEQANSLILDLRNNPGGSNTFSDKVLAFFADQPFKFASSFKVKTSAVTKKFWEQQEDTELEELRTQILTHPDGAVFESEIPFHQPRQDTLQFSGEVYVLINRYSYSQAAVTAAMVQDYGFGTLIGEPTADVATTYGSVHQFSLPNTGIPVTYPKAHIVRPNGNEEPAGVTPDILVQPDFTTAKDEILGRALQLTKEERSEE